MALDNFSLLSFVVLLNLSKNDHGDFPNFPQSFDVVSKSA
jgi:hypothetical protein